MNEQRMPYMNNQTMNKKKHGRESLTFTSVVVVVGTGVVGICVVVVVVVVGLVLFIPAMLRLHSSYSQKHQICGFLETMEKNISHVVQQQRF